ncbi:basic salivary proline-rich protein 1-like isoform X3 [Corvus moneduloides]|uniref:basic salivary proline-rich protein 1-like isoform X3 n=1 Tax=Corvus moneduloides TaxID=1196302 RepID=UPI001362DAFF|nr:basic salivary proline-rich protein 1-like isoform X3 [Corvus moneduloides]
MERTLSLEQRTERLVQRRSTLGDPLVQWRLRRCQREEPALDAPSAGRALPGSAAPQGALQGVPRGRSHDPPGALQGAVPWGPRDPPGGHWPIRRHLCKPLRQGAPSAQAGSQEPLRREPCWRPPGSRGALWATGSGPLGARQGALYSQSRDSREALSPVSRSCWASLHQGAPPCGKRESHEPLRQEPCWGSPDCLEALRCASPLRPRDSQDALRPAREALPEPLRRGGPGLRSREPREAPQPLRSSARDALQGAPLQRPLGPSRPSWNPHQGAPNPWAAGESLLWHLQHLLTWGSARGGETTAVKGTWHQRRHQQSKKHFPSSSWCQVNSDGRSGGFGFNQKVNLRVNHGFPPVSGNSLEHGFAALKCWFTFHNSSGLCYARAHLQGRDFALKTSIMQNLPFLCSQFSLC